MPIAGEFGRIFEEIRFGREYRDALTKLLERNPGVFDLQLLVSSMLLQRETGGNLIEILDNTSRPDATRAMAAVGLGMIGDLLEVPRLSRLSKDYNYRASVADLDELLYIL